MPRKPKTPRAAVTFPPVPAEILDQFVRAGPLSAADVEAATRRFKKALIERALGAELSHHLGYPPGAAKPQETPNHRNGTSGKTVLTDDGPVPIEVPRDRAGTFEPQLIAKHERRFTGLRLPVIFVLCNNGGYRIIKQRLKAFHGSEVFIGMDFKDPAIDPAGLARAFGMRAHRIEDGDAFEATFKEALAEPEPVLLDVLVDGRV
jgi:hypothetical protein